ncbi:MAG TPA: hypothetical protein ENN96_01885 [Candidatus Acetothermia bacterium]|nr:hypothetical protein [Candidatus Acetothermia bacterium]
MPRVLAVGFVVLMAMYAVDVFVEGRAYRETGVDFLLRLIPAICALCILLIGWRRDGLASLGFLALALAYFVALRGWRSVPETVVLFLPPAGISLSFFARMKLLQRSVPSPDRARRTPDGKLCP